MQAERRGNPVHEGDPQIGLGLGRSQGTVCSRHVAEAEQQWTSSHVHSVVELPGMTVESPPASVQFQHPLLRKPNTMFLVQKCLK